MKQAPERILFIKLLGLGSLINSVDAIAAIKQRYPGTKLVLLTDSNIANGIEPFGLFDEIYRTDTGKLSGSAFYMLRFLSRTWHWKSLWVLDLEVYSKLTTVLSLLTAATNRVGFYLPQAAFRKYLNTHNIPFDQQIPIEDNYALMSQVLGATERSQFRYSGITERFRGRCIVLNNTCSDLAYVRKLPGETLNQTAEWILTHTRYPVAFLGAASDSAQVEELISSSTLLTASRERVHNYAGFFPDFKSYYTFLANDAVCLISIDSAPLHIAKKLGVPTLSLWGPTHPDHYLKIHPDEVSLHRSCYLATSCSPCIHRSEQLPCGGDNICMKQIPSGLITEQLQQLLETINTAV